jgi:hypothetical protein
MDLDQEPITISVTDTVSNTTDTINVTTWDFGNLCPNLTLSNNSWLNSNIADSTIQVWDSNAWPRSSGTISLRGDDADIDVNGVSLMETLKDIQDRLNMLCPSPDMEAEWDDLRAIREQYEAKLKECQEKSRAWKALQQNG